MDAHDILTLVRPLGVIGVSIGDLADPDTWAFQGEDGQPASPAIRALAVQAINDLLSPPQPSSQFWPSPLQALADTVDRITRHLGLTNA